MALAPRRPLLGVPSSSIIARSRPAWSSASSPATAAAISPLTFATARPTPLPPHRSPPSRSSTASNSPVDAPEGTVARPAAPERSATSTSTVGLARLSMTCRARVWRISLMRRSIFADPPLQALGRRPQGELGVHAGGRGELNDGEQRLPDGRLEPLARPVSFLGEPLEVGLQVRQRRRAVDATPPAL